MLKLGILGSGRGTNFVAIYNNIMSCSLPATIEVVISDKKSKMLDFAEEKKLKNFYIDPNEYKSREEYDKQIAKILEECKVDLVILAGYMRILSADFIKTFSERILNIHPSLLPSFKGLYPQRQALSAGVKYAGCTVHVVTEALDSGQIIDQESVEVFAVDDEESLSARILEKEHLLYSRAIKYYAQKRNLLPKEK